MAAGTQPLKRFLITTADEGTWRRDRPVLFLGEWCRLYDRRDAWENLDAEVVPFHWDDRQTLDRDCERVQAFYEQLLCWTTAALNEHHQTDRSSRYWRILLGPWLIMFTYALFDRWTTVRRATEDYQIDETLICDIAPATMIPPEPVGSLYQDTTWNHYMIGKVIQWQNRIPWRLIAPSADGVAAPPSVVRPSRVRSFRIGVRDGISSLLGSFTTRDEAMILRSYLPWREEIKLQLALRQLPKWWSLPKADPEPPDMAKRERFQLASDSTDPFVQFAVATIPQQIPTVFLEGYGNLGAAADRLRWPSRPRVIFTSNADYGCVVFQEWAARKAEAGHPLVIGQHGGHVGVARWHLGEDHQVKVADRYLSWGWQDDRSRVHPALAFNIVGKPVSTWNPSGNLLLVTHPYRLFGYRLMSQPIGANQSARFVGEQIQFALALDDRIRATLTVRVDAAQDRAGRTSYVQRWVEAVPGVDIDPSTESFERPLRRCRLLVYTYNSTGFLETLTRDIPTLIFWNPWYFELRPSAQPYFDRLAKVGIFHETPESAARHVATIWDDVAGWWNQPSVQEARRVFCQQYARMPAKPLRILKQALLTAPVRTKG